MNGEMPSDQGSIHYRRGLIPGQPGLRTARAVAGLESATTCAENPYPPRAASLQSWPVAPLSLEELGTAMSNLMRTLVAGSLVSIGMSTFAHAAGPEASPGKEPFRPDPASVQRFGAGYRYPQAGWIVLHIEGEPYERGYQHGRLMAPEITRFVEALAAYRSPKAPGDAWRAVRLVANAMFLRKFDAEYLEEMKGIADGAAAAGARFDGRPLDLLDIVTVNADIETSFLDGALDATATGLEGKQFREPAEGAPVRPREGHCSAFAATGPATA